MATGMMSLARKYLIQRLKVNLVREKLLASSNPYIVVPVVGFIALKRISKFFNAREDARSKPLRLKVGRGESFLIASKSRSEIKSRLK